jgi:hypothetical protein
MCNSQSCYTGGNTRPHVHTMHNNQIVLLEVGDYIIPEPDGVHFYPCKEEVFKKTYRPYVEEDLEKSIDAVSTFVKDATKNGLETEVVYWALNGMKNDPSQGVSEAIASGYHEWVK